MRKIFSFSFAALVVLALSAFSTMAQSTTQGAIGGTVKDAKGGVIANAPITVKNNETNKEVTLTSTDEGSFRTVNLDPGTYSVTVTAGGFQPWTNAGIVVEVGRVTSLDIEVSVQGQENIVEVIGDAPVINTQQQ